VGRIDGSARILQPIGRLTVLAEREEKNVARRQLRDRVRQVKAFLAQGWNKSQLVRKQGPIFKAER